MRHRLARIRRRQKGLTLIEAAMVLGVAAIVIAGVLVLYNTANTSNKTSEALNQLNIIQQAVRQIYGGGSSFSDLTTQTLADSKVLPARMINAGATPPLVNAFNGTIDVNYDATSGGFSVDFGGLPVEACVTLATKDYGRSLASLAAGSSGGNPLMDDKSAGLPSATLAGQACDSNSANHLIWIFRN
ncbi:MULTISPECIES: type 4 pilus major pilin [unclassified Bradyrhizobium]